MTFRNPQYAEDWGFLGHRCLPTNVDGLTYHIVERKSRFLFLEVKRGTESMSQGQEIMLQKLAQVPEFTVIMLNSRMVVPDYQLNTRAVVPFFFQVMGVDGKLSDPVMTDCDDFRSRYEGWFLGKKTF